MLKPSVTSVELHSHDNELAVVVEGSNLWFCYQISIGGHTVQTPAHDLSGTSIQFNIQREESKVKVEEEKVMAVLYSHFSKKPLSKQVPALQKVSANDDVIICNPQFIQFTCVVGISRYIQTAAACQAYPISAD